MYLSHDLIITTQIPHMLCLFFMPFSAMNKALYELSQQIAKSMAKEFEILAKKTESK